ncbi:MAG: hypothetical protein ABI193_09380 [Minicystis sp.]
MRRPLTMVTTALIAAGIVACGPPEMPPAAPSDDVAPPGATGADAAPRAERSPQAPAGCTVSPPIKLRGKVPNASASVSAVLQGGTLWVFYMGRGKNELGDPMVLEVTNLDSTSPTIAEHALPFGNLGSSGALTAYQGGVIGTYVGIDRKVTIFVEPGGSGRQSLATAPSDDTTTSGSIAVIGGRALVAFGENEYGVHVGWFDPASMRFDGALHKIGTGKVQQPTVAAAFGGMVFFSDFSDPKNTGVIRAQLASGTSAPFVPVVLDGNRGSKLNATGGDGRAYLIFSGLGPPAPGASEPSSLMKLATLTDAQGHGKSVDLGAPGWVAESAIQPTPWGAIAAFLDVRTGVSIAAVNREGALIGAPQPVTAEGERARSPAVAVSDRTAYVVWNQMDDALLRMAAVRCK